ncbi:hypothetical protein PF005_g4384 [Phytophthora fragariae]|uniref:LicD family protein n=2 Tax=Phytophthora fragariae TaxID=53985 RepID=A0A6A3FZ42_9STRA|nr:hypothetical protein PF009_g917 [Phytophthora fragariae]KAE9014103.1 hypothetical protein PF011_g8201 [Phytophthora fragariae]KAE9148035.1 hypothetical protein PF006_g7340 [Phytophthora fragariae]KAE9228248.1 hypothetical protein PF005_g4384 [Phytophthora fragariae]KAE9238471.1 hypothetical protein PF004_g8319 [Phytophthora fragariae]
MAKKLEDGVEVTKNSPARPVGCVGRFLLGCKDFWTGMTVIPTFALVLIGLVVFGLVIESHIISCMHVPQTTVLKEEEVCTPAVLNASTIEYHSGHRYYSALKEMDPSTTPTFRGKHTTLCNESARAKAKYGYCLPISGRKDTPFCTAGDRTDLLSVRSPKSVCYASVLHMLMVEVYEELKASGNTPLITFGSLLGAVRNGSMIPFTEDTDIGLPLTKNFAVPYVDLYQMRRFNNGNWDIQELQGSNGRLMPYNKVEPFSQVTINGMPFDTVHDPDFFLKEAYGPNYMTPKRRMAPGVVTKDLVKEMVKKLTFGAKGGA